MTREEFQRWKHDGKEVWIAVKEKIKSLEYETARGAGIDERADRFKAGLIQGMELVLDVDWEEEDTIDDNS